MTWKKTWTDFHIMKQTQLYNYLIKTYKNLDLDTFIENSLFALLTSSLR